MKSHHSTKTSSQRLALLGWTAAILFALASPAEAQTVTLIDPGTDNRIATITGLTISGVTYDATFHHGLSFSALPSQDITFEGNAIFDFTNSRPAAEAIASAVSTAPNVSNPTIAALVPANTFFGNRVSLSYIPFQPNYSDWEPSDVVGAYTSQTFTVPANFAWVSFEEAVAAVPEPSSLTGALGLLAVGTMTCRRRRKTDANTEESKS